MLTFSIAWLVLAAIVILVATMRRATPVQLPADIPARQSGRALITLAMIYAGALVAGFLYVCWHNSLEVFLAKFLPFN